MGLGPRWTCSRSAPPPEPPNPDPTRFRVLKEEQVHGRSILLVRYEGCTTFDGLKLLLLRGEWDRGRSLDPHLLGPHHSVCARFEPIPEGWQMARVCAWSRDTVKPVAPPVPPFPT